MEFIGWVGVVLFIVAYLLLSLEVLSANKPVYHWMNFAGAICLIINAVNINDYPNIVVNTIWGLIAISTAFKLFYKKTKK